MRSRKLPRRLELKLRIFSVFVLFLIIVPLFAEDAEAGPSKPEQVLILRPGDVVKGKKITEKFYCYREKDQKELLKCIEFMEKFKDIALLQDQKIQVLEERLGVKEEQIMSLRLIVEKTKELANHTFNRENRMKVMIAEMQGKMGQMEWSNRHRETKGFMRGLSWGSIAGFIFGITRK